MSLSAKISELANVLLRRRLTSEEQYEIYQIADVLGMRDVHSFLYLLLIFKLHEDVMDKKFKGFDKVFNDMARQFSLHENAMEEKFRELSEIEERINETLNKTLERAVNKVLEEGTQRIGADMGDAIIVRAEELLTSVAKYHSLRAQTVLVCFICIVSVLAYSLGSGDILQYIPSGVGGVGGILEAFLFLPGGWSVFFCGVTYTFLWVSDHQKHIKKTLFHKILLVLQVVGLLVLALRLL
ncbi:MAG: hypothetical protein LBC93_04820 [Synergistaceae bacterium]|jgi:hypothetical protein|nr:hypothetical protein [Synergistaceae bacterium]